MRVWLLRKEGIYAFNIRPIYWRKAVYFKSDLNADIKRKHVYAGIKEHFTPKIVISWLCAHPQAMYRWVCFFMGTDLDKFSITSLSN